MEDELEAKGFQLNIAEFDIIRKAVNTLTNLDNLGGNRQVLNNFNAVGATLEKQGLECGFLKTQDDEPKEEEPPEVEVEVVE